MKNNNPITKTAILFAFFYLFSLNAFTNNVRFSNASRNATDSTVTFTMSWDNSWYVIGAPANHDAIWVFVKYRECGTAGEWNHALLNTILTEHTLDNDLIIAKPISTLDRNGDATGPHNTGALIRRKAVGKGNILNQTVTLKIDSSTKAGAGFDAAKEFDVKVFGVEMVFIPSGPFWVGDSSGGADRRICNSAGNPLEIISETSVVVYHHQTSATRRYSQAKEDYPKGYDEFYCMKYEITQGQYTDFLNTLTVAQAAARFPNKNDQMHDINKSGDDYFTNSRDRVCNYLSVRDVLSYLDWAALRPLTSMEWEKVCRGPGDVVKGAYAWGRADSLVEALNVTGNTSGNEICNEVYANAHYGGGNTKIIAGQFGISGTEGPLGAGIFARDTTQTRIFTGAAYYGPMDMSGNVHEVCIDFIYRYDSPTSTDGSEYSGVWGDGMLVSNWYNVTLWHNSCNWSEYFVYKGGHYRGPTSQMRIGDRISYAQCVADTREYWRGGRGAR